MPGTHQWPWARSSQLDTPTQRTWSRDLCKCGHERKQHCNFIFTCEADCECKGFELDKK